jgi:predicted DNA-binding transcriptional regulator AlpA
MQLARSSHELNTARLVEHRRLVVLTERQTAATIGLSVITLRRMRAANTGPCFIKLSEKRIGYRATDVEAWLDARTRRFST